MRHARAYGDLHQLRRQIEEERIAALTAFRTDATDGNFPSAKETTDADELARFVNRLD